MKIRKLFMAVAMLICILTTASGARAADNVLITVTATPTELSEAGMVELNFAISNYTDYELHGVTISSNGAAFALEQDELIVPANGSAYNIIIKMPVSDSQIGLAIPFTVAWTQGGEPMSKDVTVTINRAADPIISVQRKASNSLAKEGDTVNVEYMLTNSTKFDMTEITLIDEQLSDTPILTNNTLRAGNSITIQYAYKMGTEDALSTPVITYSVLGKTKTFSAIEPLTIKLISVKLAMAVEAGTPTSDGVTFNIEIKNQGNQEVKNITILDDKQNFVNQEPFSVGAGDTESISYRVVPSMTEPVRNVRFSLTGTDEQGQPYTLESTGAYEVYPYVDDTQIAASLRAEITEPWSSSLGTLKVKFTIENASSVDLLNVQISEQALGIVKVIESLEKGESAFEQVLTIGSPRNLSFTMKGLDPAGALRDLSSFTLQVAYSDATAEPEVTQLPENIGTGAFSSLAGTLSKVLIILGILMCIAFITLVTLSIAEKRQMVQLERKEQEEDIDRAFRGYTEPQHGEKRRAPQTRPVRPMRPEPDGEENPQEQPPMTERPYRSADRSSTGRMRGIPVEPNAELAEPQIARTAYSERASYRPQAARPEQPRIVPVEVEYDDEVEPAPAIELPARLSSEDQPQEHPKVIQSRKTQNATAPRRNAIRHVQKGTDRE